MIGIYKSERIVSMAGSMFYTLVVYVWILTFTIEASPTNDDILKSIVDSLQEQVMILRREQEQNRLIIHTLETRLDNQLLHKRKHQKTSALHETVTNHQPSMKPILDEELAHTKDYESGLIAHSGDGTNFQEATTSQPLHYLELSKEDILPKEVSITDKYHDVQPGISKEQNNDDLNLFALRQQLQKQSHVEAKRESANHQDLRSEWDTLRIEVQKLRHEMESQKSKFSQQGEYLSELKSGYITTKWLQKTVEDVRREISELAAALNISVAIRQSQQLETVLDRVRTDLASLRGEVEHGGAGMARQAAAVQQLKEELLEVRQMATTIITDHQQLLDEVSLLREEIVEPPNFVKSKETKIPIGEFSELEHFGSPEGSGIEEVPTKIPGAKDDKQPHHNRHWKQEVEQLKANLNHLQRSHSLLNEELNLLRRNYSTSLARVDNTERTITQMDNTTSQWYEEHAALSGSLDNVHVRLTLVEEKTQQNGRNIVNMTEAMTGMDKVHSSTIQLFEALEGLEEEYSQSIGELQKEVSKFEFNVAQVQGAFDILRHDQSSHHEELKALKVDFSSLQHDFRKDHYRLISMQNEVLNKSLLKCADEGQNALRDLKLAHLELQLSKLTKREDDSKQQANHMYSRLLQKVDKSSLNSLETSQKIVLEEVRNISFQLPYISGSQTKLKNELMKFVRNLPYDCSMRDVPNRVPHYLSGVYLIQVPNVHGATEVYCDMDTQGKRWTMIQRRMDGSEDFFRDWADYKRGFGDTKGEFWLGNEIIHELTQARNYTLRIDMWDVFDRYMYAEYDGFRVSSEEELYKLEVGHYKGNASDALKHHHNMAFSTHDRDNDVSSTHCAMYYSAGWWYQHCQYVNVNGRYAIGMTWYDSENKDWVQLAKVEMKVRVTDNS